MVACEGSRFIVGQLDETLSRRCEQPREGDRALDFSGDGASTFDAVAFIEAFRSISNCLEVACVPEGGELRGEAVSIII